MMQFTEAAPSPPPPSLHQISPFTRPWPGFHTPKGLGTATSSFGDTNCMEQLLVHCADAIESNDVTLAQQLLWVLHNIAPPDGDSNQRLACGFLRALMGRAATSGNCKWATAMAHATSLAILTHKFTIIELASFIDLTPWHRFGFTAANSAILEAIEGFSTIHIIDLSLTHCMQIPTLIDAISARLVVGPDQGPPLVKLTVAGVTEDIPPMLDISYEELGLKLVNFARLRNVTLEFRVIPSSSSDGFSTLIEQIKLQNLISLNSAEALVINCHMMLHYVPDETLFSFESSSYRSMFLKLIRSLDPNIVILVDEDADFTSNNLVSRLRSAFNYFWIPYDTVDTFLPKGCKQRQWYEADVCWKIENVIAQEGQRRVERLESKVRWAQRMRNSNFHGVGFSEDTINEVRCMLDEHAAGWGLKRDEEDLVLTWKGHNVVFATAWVPT